MIPQQRIFYSPSRNNPKYSQVISPNSISKSTLPTIKKISNAQSPSTIIVSEGEYWKKKFQEVSLENNSLRIQLGEQQKQIIYVQQERLKDQARLGAYQSLLKSGGSGKGEEFIFNSDGQSLVEKLSLNEQEQQIQSQVQSLANQINDFKKNAQLSLNQQDQLRQIERQQLEQIQEQERQRFQQDLANIQETLNQKMQEIQDWQNSYNQIQTDLILAQQEKQRQELESNLWMMRATSAEKEKKEAIEQHIRDKQQTVNQLMQERQIERQALENNIAMYRSIVDQKQLELESLGLSLAETQQKKLELEHIQEKLRFSIQDLERRNFEDTQKYKDSIQTREQIHQQFVNEQRQVNELERGRLRGDIKSLEQQNLDKEQRLQATSQDAALYKNKYEITSNLEQQRSIEADQWRKTADSLMTQKEFEVQYQINQKINEINKIQTQNTIEKSQLQQEKNLLVNTIQQREAEIHTLAAITNQKEIEVISKERSLSELRAEAEKWRKQAIQIDLTRQAQIQQEQSLRSQQVSYLQAQNLQQQSVLKNQIDNLNALLSTKTIITTAPTVIKRF